MSFKAHSNMFNWKDVHTGYKSQNILKDGKKTRANLRKLALKPLCRLSMVEALVNSEEQRGNAHLWHVGRIRPYSPALWRKKISV